MNMKKVHGMVVGAVIAALYVALNFTQEAIIPSSTTMAVQFRLAEALSVLCLFTPAAIPGVTVGCLVANMTAMSALPLDMLLGSAATLFSCLLIYRFRKVSFKELPIFSLLMPALFNGVIIGLQIEIFFVEGSFHLSSFLIQGGLVALGEAAVMFTVGIALIKIIKNKKLEKYLFSI